MQTKLQVNPDDGTAHTMIEMYTKNAEYKEKLEDSEAWMQNNLEYDLRSSDYIAEKCKVNSYAQNLYAALCNNDFMRNEMWPILKEEIWGCSWRYAGGIIADILQSGDYLDWYCSGIMSEGEYIQGYVPESTVTDEIREDLLNIGWLIIPESEEQ